MTKKNRCVEDRAEILQDVRKDLGKLLRSLTPEAFEEQWEHIQVEWADQKTWLKYMAKEYIPTKEQWAQAWHQVHSFFKQSKILLIFRFCSMLTKE